MRPVVSTDSPRKLISLSGKSPVGETSGYHFAFVKFAFLPISWVHDYAVFVTFSFCIEIYTYVASRRFFPSAWVVIYGAFVVEDSSSTSDDDERWSANGGSEQMRRTTCSESDPVRHTGIKRFHFNILVTHVLRLLKFLILLILLQKTLPQM